MFSLLPASHAALSHDKVSPTSPSALPAACLSLKHSTSPRTQLTSHLPLPSQLARALGSVDEWTFDAFQFEAASDGRPLSCLAFFLIKRMGLVTRFGLDEPKLAK